MTRASSAVGRERLRHLASTLDGIIVLPDDVAYDQARQVWNRAVDRRPAAIVSCASVDDVRRGLEFALTHRLEIAVRSGGHSQAGHGVADGALVLDLRALNRVVVDPSSLSARVEGGAIVSELMTAWRPYGLVTPTGGCADVGLGGLTLGGGENMLMARYGAVCDNLLATEVVLADGRLVVANPREHADLFWAIRGGGGNFGIVTGFEYQLFRLDSVLSGLFYFPVSRTADVLHVYRNLIAEAPDELQTAGGLTGTPEGPALIVAFCYCGVLAHGERIADLWRKWLRPTKDTVQAGPVHGGVLDGSWAEHRRRRLSAGAERRCHRRARFVISERSAGCERDVERLSWSRHARTDRGHGLSAAPARLRSLHHRSLAGRGTTDAGTSMGALPA